MLIRLLSTEKGIKLVDGDGKDVMRVLPKEVKARIKEQKERQFKQTSEEIRYQIAAHDVVSFDIFDTLITRRVHEPEMVFDLVGKFAVHNGIRIDDFRRERIKAQLDSGLSNANLDEVYVQLAQNTGITREQAEILKKEELKCERCVVVPRDEMVELFKYALEAQKKVFLTTDMYLNRRYIVSLLNKCGITGYYDIFDSCEYRKLKLEGLFDVVKEENPGKSILHIGDSYINDCICAEVAGIDSMLISKGIDIAEKSKTILLNQFEQENDKLLIGTLVAGAFNSPFVEVKNHEQLCFDIGYSYVGPLVLSFAGWIVKNIDLNKYDGLLLSARDGFLLNRTFNIFKERKIIPADTEIHYFYTSRKAAVAMHTDEEPTINMLIDNTASLYWPDKLLRDVFCMDEDSVDPYDIDAYGEDRYKYVWDRYEDIKANARRLRRNFYRYLRKEGLIIGGRYMFYDFVSSGTVQKALESIVPFEIDGIYYQYTGNMEFAGDAFGRYPESDIILKDNYKMMESLMLSMEPSLCCYSENGDVMFCEEGRSPHFLKGLDLVHQGVFTFINQFLDSFEFTDALISDEMTHELIQRMAQSVKKVYFESEPIDDWIMGSRS